MAFYRAHILVDTGTPAVLKGALAVKAALIQESRRMVSKMRSRSSRPATWAYTAAARRWWSIRRASLTPP